MDFCGAAWFQPFSEFIAKDSPVLARFDGKFYFPAFKNYSGLRFGGEFDINTDYRNPYISSPINEKGRLLTAPIHFSYNTVNSARK
ncbi:MAG: hypothetical protein LBD86_00420 [Spirochaetaceae bacterium]|jgi:microcin C transport system permease protein|nr:hypothetical protein [Spirochaetaceae bacterium]